eukprot:5330402-Prymnesium_polylepis.1
MPNSTHRTWTPRVICAPHRRTLTRPLGAARAAGSPRPSRVERVVVAPRKVERPLDGHVLERVQLHVRRVRALRALGGAEDSDAAVPTPAQRARARRRRRLRARRERRRLPAA